METKFFKNFFYIFLIILLVYFDIYIFFNNTYNYLLTNKNIAFFYNKPHINYIDKDINITNNNRIIDDNFNNLIFNNIFAFKKEVFVYSLINENGLYQKKWIKQDTKYYKNFTYITNTIKIDNLEYNIDKTLLNNHFIFKDISKLIKNNYVIFREEIDIKEQKKINIESDNELDNFVYAVSVNKEFYNNKFNVVNGFLYSGYDIKNPEIGDIKIIYKTIEYPINFKFVGFIKNNKLIPLVLNNQKLVKFNSKDNLINYLKFNDIKYLLFVFIFSNIIMYFIIKIIKFKFKKLLLMIPMFGEYIYFNKKIFLISFSLNIILVSLFLIPYFLYLSLITIFITLLYIFFVIKIDYNRF